MLRSTLLPWAAKKSSTIFLTTGLQDPQVLPALVHFVTHAGPSQLPFSATAASIWAFVTSLHEQTCASGGSPISGTPRPAGRIRSSGLSGSAMPEATIGRSTPYADASPTSTPPSSWVPSAETTSFL